MAKIRLDLSQVNRLAGRGTLVIQSDEIKAGDVLLIDGLEVDVVSVNRLHEFGRFNLEVQYNGNEIEVKEKLTHYVLK